jgi:hypothetical protein
MKTIIYYFTGTGNSLAAAKGICTHLGDCELVSIASLAGTSGAPSMQHPDQDMSGTAISSTMKITR